MSIINKMLKDLDARQSRVTDTVNYLNRTYLVSAPARAGIPRVRIVIGFVLAAVVGAAGWTTLRPLLTGHAPAPVVRAAASVNPASVGTTVSASPALPVAVPAAVPASKPVSPATVGPTVARQIVPVVSESESLSSAKQENREERQVAASGVVNKKSVPSHEASLAEKPASVTLKEAPVAIPSESTAALALPKTDVAARTRAVLMPDTPVSAGTDAMDGAARGKVFTPQQRIENDYRKAIGWAQQGRKAEAMAALEQVLQAEPGHAAARQVLIGLMIDSQRPDDARKLAREGLAQDPSQSGLAMILARLQLDNNELRSAIETLQRAQSYALGRADYQAFLAALLQRDNRHGEAIENYLLALQKTPQNGVWWMGMAISLQAENRRNEAREAYARAKDSGSLSDELLAFVDGRLQQLK